MLPAVDVQVEDHGPVGVIAKGKVDGRIAEAKGLPVGSLNPTDIDVGFAFESYVSWHPDPDLTDINHWRPAQRSRRPTAVRSGR